MRATLKSQRQFEPLGAPGIDKAEFWRGSHGVSFQLLQVKKGTYAPHFHDSWEAMYVTAGKIKVGGTVFEPGDFLFTEPGETHQAEVLEETTVLVGFGKN